MRKVIKVEKYKQRIKWLLSILFVLGILSTSSVLFIANLTRNLFEFHKMHDQFVAQIIKKVFVKNFLLILIVLTAPYQYGKKRRQGK
ncbi:hypothetical protein PC41400_04070 [Paenibacillus chitinolyticus]|uniref:Uncharacterized protein n=1 Tax=Paenibacillus chitinolyticus TaxID=79263 RepID=A0A410WRA6_9BACL|nr:hypothetical protein PC41400_04070 [Paenibacillus chitinolyticus]GKS12188.1 hypothetical protein YDYSY3_31880 [Paenibacillus chitinolyticus]